MLYAAKRPEASKLFSPSTLLLPCHTLHVHVPIALLLYPDHVSLMSLPWCHREGFSVVCSPTTRSHHPRRLYLQTLLPQESRPALQRMKPSLMPVHSHLSAHRLQTCLYSHDFLVFVPTVHEMPGAASYQHYPHRFYHRQSREHVLHGSTMGWV